MPIPIPISSSHPPPSRRIPRTDATPPWGFHPPHTKVIALSSLVLFITVLASLSLSIWIKRRYFRRRRGDAGSGLRGGSASSEWDADAVESAWRAGKARKSPTRGCKGARWADEDGDGASLGLVGEGQKRVAVKGLAVAGAGEGSAAGNQCLKLDPDFGDRGDWNGNAFTGGDMRGESWQERERWRRAGERVKAGYDGFRGN